MVATRDASGDVVSGWFLGQLEGSSLTWLSLDNIRLVCRGIVDFCSLFMDKETLT